MLLFKKLTGMQY